MKTVGRYGEGLDFGQARRLRNRARDFENTDGVMCADVWAAYPPIETRSGFPISQISAAKKAGESFRIVPIIFTAGAIFARTHFARQKWDAVVVVPTTRKDSKRLLQFYGQVIAAAVKLTGPADWLSLTTLYGGRVRMQQKKINSDRVRRCNVDGYFKAADVQGKRIILVDDVATSGGTLSAAARCLYRSGADAVLPVVLYCHRNRTRLDLQQPQNCIF